MIKSNIVWKYYVSAGTDTHQFFIKLIFYLYVSLKYLHDYIIIKINYIKIVKNIWNPTETFHSYNF